MNLQPSNVICALATPAGGAIGVIRLSGSGAIELVDKVFRPASQKSLTFASANTIHYGEIVDSNGNTVDDVLISVFRAPHSYTGEDSIEISCHGSRYVLQQVLHVLICEGARQAAPGEYTRRAYMNGKMDLSQAEAVADLIAATNRATHKIALSQLKGHFSSQLSVLRDKLLKINSLLELELDFSDHEELEFADRSELRELAETIMGRIKELARSFETGNAMKNGVPVAIVGKTNVGKSTLLNQLLHEDKAIVSDIQGTTRDVIEDTTEISGITFRFIDTAGIRKTSDVIENLGIERTWQKLDEAQIVIYLNDDTQIDEDGQLIADDYFKEIVAKSANKKLLLVLNKCDKLPEVTVFSEKGTLKLSGYDFHILSAKAGRGLQSLENALVKAADIPEITENDVIITNSRHYEALLRAGDSLSRVIEAMDAGLSGDLIAEDLRQVLIDLGEITGGQISSQETLNNIFKHFCVGK